MGSTRRSFTEGYKREAVNFVVEGGRSVAEVARNIGVHEMTLGRWVRKAKDSEEPAVEVPHVFRTAYSRLIHAADCNSRYSSWACFGVL
ncbi:hypothetical protein E1263_17535 [Kribbella antibiotica]|uniref:Transposase n=1 Tax=Kribbella antibiotica TaxID=190195 RepID=A0A4R4ZK30_9ACTN|nr:hypothetical protein E1263_17535 [Kribbella antibiotica]